MSPKKLDTVIVGGGLSGIYAAYLLAQKEKTFALLEARERLGGRILSPEHRGYHVDLGPSWYWPEIHPKMASLIKKLGLVGYPQFETGLGRFQHFTGSVQTVRGYPSRPASWRLEGGMALLIETLIATLPADSIYVNHPVCHIEKASNGLSITVGELEKPPLHRFEADHVILALPPRLAAMTILFTPELSDRLTQGMLGVGTWMAGQAKFCALYETPFWRQTGLSGQAFSECGPLGEIHDGSNNGCGPFGLTGFIGIPAAQRSQLPNLNQKILDQLASLFGGSAANPIKFYYQDWASERYTATVYDQPPMREHPVYSPPAGKTSIWNKAILFSGTETATLNGGYLEGALEAAERVANQIAP
jgi:monoamine oxidase